MVLDIYKYYPIRIISASMRFFFFFLQIKCRSSWLDIVIIKACFNVLNQCALGKLCSSFHLILFDLSLIKQLSLIINFESLHTVAMPVT